MAMVGVDIGSTEVRVVQVEGIDQDGMAIVSRLGVSELRPDAVVAGRIRNKQQVALALKRAIKDAGVKRYGFIIGLSSSHVALGSFELPDSIKPSERIQVIKNTGHEISPAVPAAESVLAAQVVSSRLTSEGNRINTLSVIAALESEVNDIKDICRLADVQPRAIDITAAATMRALYRIDEDSRDIATFVDMGATKITVGTRQGGYLRSMRTVAGGGDHITRALMSETGDAFEDAQNRKESMKVGLRASSIAAFSAAYTDEEDIDVNQDRQTHIEETFNRAVEGEVDKIVESLEQDIISNAGARPGGIFLSGKSALMRGLKERVQARTGIPTSTGRPWASLQRNKYTERFFKDSIDETKLLLGLTPAIGLAIWKGSSK